MILEALTKYYQRIPNVAEEGFQKQEISFVIVLKKNGAFAGLQDLREGEGKKKRGQSRLVPKAVKRTVKPAANLLWDNTAYVLGKPRPDKKKDYDELVERAKEQHALFIQRIKDAFPLADADEGIFALLKFFDDKSYEKVFTHPLWNEMVESGSNISFQLEGETELICQRPAVMKVVKSTETAESSEGSQVCMITGEPDMPKRLHTAIKGVWGAQSSGANIVSFNLSAFNSYGKEQGYNAPVGSKAEFAYSTALNTLLDKDSRQRIQVGDATTVFWAEKKHDIEEWFTNIFGKPEKTDTGQDEAAIKALFKSPETGVEPILDDRTQFYVLGLAPNASRISIRFWYARTVGEVERNIIQHFKDLSINHAPKQPGYQSIFRLLASTALQGKAENIQPNLAGDFMNAILSNTPYPRTLLASVVRRVKAEREVTYQRAALIKAFLVREKRNRNQKEELEMSLDRSNANSGYLLGRLFAVLEKIQEEASPGLNVTIRDRFYGSASSTPVTAFPHLMKLKNHHLSKIENKGRAVFFEKEIGEVLNDLNGFPPHMSLEDQGYFAVGYYHQRQDFFKKRENY